MKGESEVKTAEVGRKQRTRLSLRVEGISFLHNGYDLIRANTHTHTHTAACSDRKLLKKALRNHHKSDPAYTHLPLNRVNSFILFKVNKGHGFSPSKYVLVSQNGTARERKKEKKRKDWIFIEVAAKWSRESGADGEWLQTQGNYFLAVGMEGARASFINRLFITDG